LTVLTPDASRVLIGGIEDEEGGVTGINIDINQGDRVLIVGPSGSGKSSFVRAIAGLWEVGSGSVAWSSDASAFFLPQRPYNVLGTLREQIMYPNIQGSSAGEDESFREIMRKVRLGDLIERMGGLDATKDWSKTLSLGEQQRLAFARVLYNKPSVVFLDESTSALDLKSEEALYTLLKELGVTFVSVGHRPSLLRYHTSKITLLGNGKSPLVSDIDPMSSTLI
jgi:putative ATP-binding cassette transporter